MNAWGWIIVTLFIMVSIYVVVKLILDTIWNQRLKNFQINNNLEKTTGLPTIAFIRRGFVAIMSLSIVVLVFATGVFNLPVIEDFHGKSLLSARTATSEQDIRNKINNKEGFYFFDFFGVGNATPGLEEDMAGNPPQSEEAQRDVIETNLQEEGVDEADIVKTDGYHIYYVSGYQRSRVEHFFVNEDGTVTVLTPLVFDDFVITEFYLTETQLVFIGYTFEEIPYTPEPGAATDDIWFIDYPYNWYYTRYTGTVKIYDRETETEAYSLETDGNIQTHRIIEDTLYMVSYQYISTEQEELRPYFNETINDISNEVYLDYNEIIYFDEIPAYQYVVLTAINLSDYTFDAQAILGSYYTIYASYHSIYLTGSYQFDTFFQRNQGTQIVKFKLDHEASTVTYVGQKSVQGYIENQFWMDEKDGLLRVVTSISWWSEDVNRLYILEEDDETDEMNVVGLLEEGLGKPNERVMSARFEGDEAYVVTFRNTDPLYTIDLSDPTKPVITNEIEEPGYSTYLHKWGENQLIGLGYDQNWGIKISAYNTEDSTEPLETYYFNPANDDQWVYSWSEALNNHKAIMISPEHGFLGFAASSNHYTEITNQFDEVDYKWTYYNAYYVFMIDFDDDQIIKDPLVISHGDSEYNAQVERGIYINGIIYTISFNKIVSYDLANQVIFEEIPLLDLVG